MDAARLLRHVIRPGLTWMADVLGDQRLRARNAEVLLLAIALQESGCCHRWQIRGPARGYWQFERGGGLLGVLQHPATDDKIRRLCVDLNLQTDIDALWTALPYSELLQVACARLLLWSDPRGLPAVGEQAEAWQFYLRNWRPGKPHPVAWPRNYCRATELCADD